MVVRLTPGQAKVVPYVIQGMNYAEIARRMGLSIWTVRSHVYAIAAKLDRRDGVLPFRRVYLWAVGHHTLSPEPSGESRSRPLSPPQDYQHR